MADYLLFHWKERASDRERERSGLLEGVIRAEEENE